MFGKDLYNRKDMQVIETEFGNITNISLIDIDNEDYITTLIKREFEMLYLEFIRIVEVARLFSLVESDIYFALKKIIIKLKTLEIQFKNLNKWE